MFRRIFTGTFILTPMLICGFICMFYFRYNSIAVLLSGPFSFFWLGTFDLYTGLPWFLTVLGLIILPLIFVKERFLLWIIYALAIWFLVGTLAVIGFVNE